MKKLILISLAGMLILAGCVAPEDGKYAAIAQCLTQKNVKMYGAWWCPNCTEQKKIFGDDIRYVTYVECADGGDVPANKAACKTAGVDRYPTWVFPGQDNLIGVQSPEALAKKANCEDPNLDIEGAILDDTSAAPSSEVPTGSPSEATDESEVPTGSPSEAPDESEVPTGSPSEAPDESEVPTGEPSGTPAEEETTTN